MKILRKIAIIFFDIIDLYYHQKKILKFIRNNNINLKYFLDIGAHKGTYTDLIVKEFNECKVLMFEPQKDIFKAIKKKYQNKKNIKIYDYAISDKSTVKKIYINQHDLTSSLSTLDTKNNYLQFKAKLFSTTSSGMIVKKVNVKTKKLEDLLLSFNNLKSVNEKLSKNYDNMQNEHSELLKINDGLIKDYDNISKEMNDINRQKLKLESKLKVKNNEYSVLIKIEPII